MILTLVFLGLYLGFIIHSELSEINATLTEGLKSIAIVIHESNK